MRLNVLASDPDEERFDVTLQGHGFAPLSRSTPTTLQVNLGKRCNQACNHCHVDAGPRRTEQMDEGAIARLLELTRRAPALDAVDITGGAPELHPQFRALVAAMRALGKHVIDRCNLTVLLEPGQQDLPEFLAAQAVEVTASLPCYGRDNVDAQRGKGVFDKSVQALRRLNALGFGMPGSPLRLSLVYNPGGAFLPPAQATLEASYRRELRARYGIEFHQLLTLANMPIKRFEHALRRERAYERYMQMLRERFNPQTVEGLMCRSQINVGYDGVLYDCDFNQMLELPLRDGAGRPRTLWSIGSLDELASTRIVTASHCHGCTAGAGSSCGGSLSA